MDEPSEIDNKPTAETRLRVSSDSDAVLANWTEGIDATPPVNNGGINQRRSKARAEKHIDSTPKEGTNPNSGTKDPTKSLKSDAQLQTKGSKTPSGGSKLRKKAAGKTTAAEPSSSSTHSKGESAPKERLSSARKSAASDQSSSTDMAVVLKEAFSGFAVQMNKGFSSLNQLLQAKNDDAKGDDNASALSESDDTDGGSDIEPEEPAPKKQKTDDNTVLSKDNSAILSQLEKEFNVSEQDGAEINENLAVIVQKLLKEKPEEDKLNEIKKRYLRPKNCATLAETRVNLAIWNNLSDRARTSDIKLQKVQKSLIKGTTSVVQLVNDLISTPDMLPKDQIVSRLMDGVLLMANANIELNIRRREALKPELHTSYCYLCAPSNPITTELFGDDLPKAVKDITDTNRITSKISREMKQSFKRSRNDGHSDRYQSRYKNNYSGPSKNYRRPFFNKKEGGKKSAQKNQN